MKYICLLILCFNVTAGLCNAQTTPAEIKIDTIYYSAEIGTLMGSEKGKAIGFGLKEPFNPIQHHYKIWYMQSKTLLAEYETYDLFYINKENNVRSVVPIKNGKYKEWYLSGEKKCVCTYKEDKLDGEFVVYYLNGVVKRSEQWKDGEWLSGDCFDEAGNKTVYCSYQEMPSFEGGIPGLMTYIGQTLKYPSAAERAGIQGVVYVHFVIDKQGNPTQIEVIKSVHPQLDAEAVRIVKSMPAWRPGRFEGNPVNVEFTLPLRFSLK